MARKLNIPSIVGLNIEGVSAGLTMFLQAVQDGMAVLDKNVVYSDSIRPRVPQTSIRAMSSQGQAFNISGVNVASGDDHAALVQDVTRILNDLTSLRASYDDLANQIKGN